MKHIAKLIVPAALCLTILGCTASRKSRSVSLFSSEFLLADAWDGYFPDAEISEEFTMCRTEEGVLILPGTPLGYICTKEDYRNFILTLQWRWPPDKQPGKGGVLIRTTGPHAVWPRSLEAQLNAGDAGDFWGLAGYPLTGPAERLSSVDHEKFGKLTNLKKTAPLEKPPGQWNTCKIVAKGDTVTLTINGKQVNRATGCDTTPGKICLTFEGNEIHFKDITLTPLPD